jgi:hypothetical protein
MDAPSKNDILASNLLFATLALLLLYQVAGWVSQALGLPYNYFSHVNFTLLTVAGMGLFLLIRWAIYQAVRRGFLAAKILVAIGFVVSLYNTTYWQQGIVAGANFTHFTVDSFVMLASNLLTLAALVLMFTKSRAVITSGT